ncbi:MAG: Flp family type IVb pilin [Pirellulaceae bacterium]
MRKSPMCRTEWRQTPPSTDGQPRATCWRRARSRRIGYAARRGVTAIEYCLIVSVISVVVISAIQQIGLATQSVFETSSRALDDNAGGGETGGGETGGSETGGSGKGGSGKGGSGKGGSGKGGSGKGGSGKGGSQGKGNGTGK